MTSEDSQASAKEMVRKLGLIFVIYVFAEIIQKLPVSEIRFLGMLLPHWILIARSIIIVILIVNVVPPLSRFVKTLLGNTVLENVQRVKVKENVCGLANRAIQLIGLAIIYPLVLQVLYLLRCYRPYGWISDSWILTTIRVLFLFIVIIILYLAWKNIDPLLRSAGESVASATEKLEKKKKPSGRKGRHENRSNEEQ